MRKKVVAIVLGQSGLALKRSTALVANGIIKWAKQEGWELLNLTAWHWKIPTSVKVDGLIHSDCSDNAETLKGIVGNIPHIVEINPEHKSKCDRYISIDWEAVGLQAAEYYLERGFRNFALAAYRTDEWQLSLRAFKERIEKAGGRCQAIQGMHMGGEDLDTIRDTVRQQLRDLTYPLGIFCANDRLAVRLCHWCIEEGIAVPEQAAILGYGNDTTACSSNPVPLSSIDPHHEQYGIEAAQLLQRMMDGEVVPKDASILVPPRGIVTRRSTDINAIADAHAARALRYIWDHYTKNIGPDNVASFCKVPRRSLDRRFKIALGRTIGKEIMRKRLSQAREMLVTADIPAADIAARVGFKTPQYFNFQFKKYFGCTPQRYRDRERKRV